MTDTTFFTSLRRHVRRWNGSTIEWDVSGYRALVDDIRRQVAASGTMTDENVAHLIAGYRERIRSGDNPFEDDPDMQLFGNTGYSLFAGLLWPFTMLVLLFKKKRTRQQSTATATGGSVLETGRKRYDRNSALHWIHYVY